MSEPPDLFERPAGSDEVEHGAGVVSDEVERRASFGSDEHPTSVDSDNKLQRPASAELDQSTAESAAESSATETQDSRPDVSPSQHQDSSPPQHPDAAPTSQAADLSLTIPRTQPKAEGIWRGFNARFGNIFKTEKPVNKAGDQTSTPDSVLSTAKGPGVDLFKSVNANEKVQPLGNKIMEGVPALMTGLESLTAVHPFLRPVFLRFRLVHQQESKRRDNDRKRMALFEKIKEIMLILLRNVSKVDTHTTPDGKPVLISLGSICQNLEGDVEACYNALDAQEKRFFGIRVMKTSSWNSQLAEYATTFITRREELLFALSMRRVITVEEIDTKMMEMFAAVMTPQEREMGRWIEQNGGKKAVLSSDSKCLEMIHFESALLLRAATSKDKSTLGDVSDSEAKAIAELRRQYRADIREIIQANFESYSKRFAIGLDDLSRDLRDKIHHQGDRIIKSLQGGPYIRIKDRMFHHIWKEQNWKGSAKTSVLLLTIRDYVVERIETSKLALLSKTSKKKIDDEDTDADMSVPLPDDWILEYLDAKRLRRLQEALDPNWTGLITVSEINTFTSARPKDWSIARWLGYWTVGAHIVANKYCLDIAKIFAQILGLGEQIRIVMPGNKIYLNEFLEKVWRRVTLLTNSINSQADLPPESAWLQEQFADYVHEQEQLLQERLGIVGYDIDSVETVSLLLRGAHIEERVLPLLTILLKRHVAKLQLGLKYEFDPRELEHDARSIMFVTDTVDIRFRELKERLDNERVLDVKDNFEWLSSGLFRNHLKVGEVGHSDRILMDADSRPWMAQVDELGPESLIDILAYTENDAARPEKLTDVLPPMDPLEAYPSHAPELPSAAELSIAGMWYGWRWKNDEQLRHPMMCIGLECGRRLALSPAQVGVSGHGCLYGVPTKPWALTGIMDSADQPLGSLAISFDLYSSTDAEPSLANYAGTFFYEEDIISGVCGPWFDRTKFLLKRVPTASVLCVRPLATKLNARELWSFAFNAVLEGIRRQNLGLSYVCDRMVKMRRTLELTYKSETDDLDDDEMAENTELIKFFTYEEFSQLYRLYLWHKRAGNLQPSGARCDSCRGIITRSRIVCLECISPNKPSYFVNFCSNPVCVASGSSPPDVAHRASHAMIKTRDMFQLMDYASTKARALEYKDQREQLISMIPPVPSPVVLTFTAELSAYGSGTPEDPSTRSPPPSSPLSAITPREQENFDVQPPFEGFPPEIPVCTSCERPVQLPCWYCLDCSANPYVCDDCEQAIERLPPWDLQVQYRSEAAQVADDRPFWFKPHTIYHRMLYLAGVDDAGTPNVPDTTLVAPAPASTSHVAKWKDVQQQIQALNKRVEKSNANVDKRLADMDVRLLNIERLLTALVGQKQ